jgi:thiol:disulfide interchange protein DsbA
MWNRREFAWSTLIGLGATRAWSATLSEAPEEGFDYLRLEQPAPRLGRSGWDVVEFFRYGCPFCYRFEPLVHAWRQGLPGDVRFHYVPVSFQSTVHQQLHLTLRQMGQVERLHMAIYHAIHRDAQPFDLLSDIVHWVQLHGVDPATFTTAWHSPAVAQAMAQANDWVRAYGVTSVPQLGVAGRYRTSPAMVGGSNERALQVTSYLIAQLRGT